MFKLGQTVYHHTHVLMGNHTTWIGGVASGQVIAVDDEKVCLLPTEGMQPVFVGRELVFSKYEYAWAFSYGAAHQIKRANSNPAVGFGYTTVLFVCGDYREVLMGEDIPQVTGWK